MNGPETTAPSAGLNLIVSNRLESLGAALAELLRVPNRSSPSDALQPEIIVVQSKGTQRWISLQLARHNGICANLRFPFPNAFIDDLYGRIIEPARETSPYAPSALTFRIMRLLPELLELPNFSELRDYFKAPQNSLKEYELARRIADLFDQYMIYRPEMLSAWEAYPDPNVPSDWQGQLWHAIKRDARSPHRSDLQQKLIASLRDAPFQMLPQRVCLFGITLLPPFHLRVLKALSERIPIHVFALNPCREYWFDIVSDHQLAKVRTQSSADTDADFHFERGNRLLASWGRMGKQYFSMLNDYEPQTSELFFEDPQDSLLKCVQRDILDLVDRPPGTKVERSADGTIRVHSCHSAMREVEVLHDQLLSFFEDHADLAPGDIMVLTPDINAYAPYIHAVFGASQILPFSVTDQTVRHQSRTLEAFLQLLDLCDSRFEAEKIIGLLEFEAIRERYDLEVSDLPIIEDWIRKVNIRWGWDGQDRKRRALPGFSENSWRSGLDRLLLGYAMLSDDEHLYGSILPFDRIEGNLSRILGSLVHFTESLNQFVQALPEDASLASWSALFSDGIVPFFKENDDNAGDIQLLRGVLTELVDLAEISDYRGKIAFDVVRHHVRDSLERVTSGAGFMVGGITFCAMLPMRSIPAQVICILGLQHDAFPQDSHEPKFNLLSAAPRIGDRSKRNDDKYLFLESLLSARRIFYLSYIGRSIRDNAEVPPSVLVSELIEYVCENYTLSKDQLVINHPLQAFSPTYFDNHNPHLFSYSPENLTAARKIGVPRVPRAFFTTDLPEPSPKWRKLDIRQLSDFLCHPSRFLLERRIGIRFDAAAQQIDHREAFNLAPLDRFLIEQKVVTSLMTGRSTRIDYATSRASGVLPHGSPGKVLYERIASDSWEFAERLKLLAGNETARSMPVRLTLDDFEIDGEIAPLFSKGIVMHRAGKMRPKDLLTGFVYHLVFNQSRTPGQPVCSFLATKEGLWEFGPISEPDLVLRRYLELYWMGLQRPLRFFPQSSYAFAHQLLVKNLPTASAIKAARSRWHSSDYGGGEALDPYFSCFFNQNHALDAQFQEIALTIFRPVLQSGRLLKSNANPQS